MVWLNDDAAVSSVILIFKTQDIETWGDWQGHQVLINGHEIGRLKDPDDDDGRYETFRLRVPKADFQEWIKPTQTFVLTIRVDTQNEHPGLSDDFLWRRLEVEHAALRLGT
ncbi:MAG: hypothetical protein JWN98_2456 [Abditibacteriota bacterium]|nr:hypothetical protein [Abditibacteriota bacterium]